MISVIGLDPGFASLGYAVIEIGANRPPEVVRFGVFETSPDSKKSKTLATEDNVRRARSIAGFLRTLVEQANGPIAFAAEAMSFPRSSSVAAKMAMCWGALAAVSESKRLPIVQASPQSVKQALCGKKNASKEEIQIAMLERYPEIDAFRCTLTKGRWEHPHDALAMAHVALAADIVCAVAALERGAA